LCRSQNRPRLRSVIAVCLPRAVPMNLRRVVCWRLLLLVAARRSLRIAASHHHAQRHDESFARDVTTAVAAREAFLPRGFGKVLLPHGAPQASGPSGAHEQERQLLDPCGLPPATRLRGHSSGRPFEFRRAAVVLRDQAPNAQSYDERGTTQEVGRRAVLRQAAVLPAAAVVLPAWAGSGTPEGMKTSESYSNLQQLAPQVTGTLGAGTISSRSRPATGVVLLEEVKESGQKDAPAVTAEIVLDGGIAAIVTFQSQPGYPLVRGMFYDVEVKGKVGDSAFLQVARLPEGKSFADVKNEFFTSAVLATEGRFGAYGAATDIKVLKSERVGPLRQIEVSFSALSPGQAEVPRRALIAAIQPDGSTDAVMLVGSSTASAWKQVEPAMRKIISSLRIASVRPTNIKRKAKADYRFEDQGGLNEPGGDTAL